MFLNLRLLIQIKLYSIGYSSISPTKSTVDVATELLGKLILRWILVQKLFDLIYADKSNRFRIQ